MCVATAAAMAFSAGPAASRARAAAAACRPSEVFASADGGDDSADIHAHDARQGYARVRTSVDNAKGTAHANAVNPKTGVHWFSGPGGQVFSAEEQGRPYPWTDLSGTPRDAAGLTAAGKGPEKEGFGFRKDARAYILEPGGTGRIITFAADRPKTWSTVRLVAAADDPLAASLRYGSLSDLAFDGHDRAWLSSLDGIIWRVDDTEGARWQAHSVVRLDTGDTALTGIAFATDRDRLGALLVSTAGTTRTIREVLGVGGNGHYLSEPLYSGDAGSYTDLASCAYPKDLPGLSAGPSRARRA
ncbi:hypothetical protein GCM10012280_48280 [Wenjunlia tyrosinilytica]|uniref:Uncharacterized protein n=1 Tax=Wenjunlia tyrosinilytica TaxID=1544741 RepID=A0A917ZUE7_9ACTN|nr:hypothetical protein GCM10012280_48280 [Wenjunlia tyrosinilytica]